MANAIPMGMKWSLYGRQMAHRSIVDDAPALREVEFLHARRPAARVTKKRADGYVYVDDSRMVGIRRALLLRLPSSYREAIGAAGPLENMKK